MAERTIKTVLEISGEGSYRNKLKEIGQALKGVASEERALSAEYGKSDSSLGKLVQQQSLLENKLKLQKERMEAVRQEYERVVQAEGENSSSAKRLAIEYNNTSAQVATTEHTLKDLNGQIEKSSGAWNKMSSWIGKNDQKLQKFGNTVSKVAGKINKVLTAATTAFATYATKSFMDFEDQMAVVSTLVDTTEVDMAEMSDKALAASNATGQAASEIAKATYSAISAGVDPAHAVSVVEAAAKGAKAGLSDTETVIDGLTTSVNAWGLAYEDSEKILDKMITTQNFGKTTLGELSANMGKVTAFAPQVGVSLEEVLAATAALTKSGYSTESAMTALKNVMSAVIKPTSQAKEAAKEMGLQFDASAMRSKGLVGFLQEVIDKTHGDEEALGKLFGSVEGLGGVMLLAGGAAKDFSGALDAISGSAGALDSAFNKRTSSRAEQLSMSLNKLKNAAIGFGQTLAPYIDLAAGAIDKLAEKLGSLSESERKTVLNTAAGLAIGTKVISVVGKLMTHAGGIVSTLGKVGAGIKGIVAASGGLKALLALAGPAGILLGATAGVVALSVSIANLDTTMEEAKEQLREGADPEKLREGLSAIEQSKIEARALAEITVDTQIKYTEDQQNLFDEIYNWLTDGEVDTPEQKQEFIDKINRVYDGLIEDIEKAKETKLGRLEKQYNDGLIDYDTFVEKTQEVSQEAASAAEQVEALRGSALEYVNEYTGATTSVVEGTREHVESLKEDAEEVARQVSDITEGIAQANTELKTTQQKALDAGYVTVESATGSIASAAEQGRIGEEAIQADYESRAKELADAETEAYAKAVEGGDAKAIKATKDHYEQLGKELEEERDEALQGNAETTLRKIQEDFQQTMAGMEGPEIDLLKLYGLKDELENMDSIDESTLASMSEPLKAQLAELAKGMFGDESFFTDALANGDTERVSQLVNALQQQLESIDPEALLGSLQGTDLGTILAGLMEEDVLDGIEGLDMSSASDILSLMLGQLVEGAGTEEATGAGSEIGKAVMEGEQQGIQEGSTSVLTAMDAAGLALINGAKSTLGVRSPSTVFADIGRNLMEGLRNGISNNRRLITAALTQLSTQLRTAGRQSMQGWINGVNGMRTALITAYASAAQAAAQAARDALDEHSPSRVFAQIGAYTAEGMIAGLNSRVGAVQTAMERMVNPPQPRRTAAGRNDGQAVATVNNYYTYNMPYTGAFGAREARKASRELARVETARKTGKGA